MICRGILLRSMVDGSFHHYDGDDDGDGDDDDRHHHDHHHHYDDVEFYDDGRDCNDAVVDGLFVLVHQS